ncbi:3-ketoacyl-CoA thiolase 2 peroxisomal [Zea mays]|uniref:3-ketoacyl-CoA thiolase 2 peroxisomal n=1 Tax=Zea mays TaxID=4577 RepID=A0A1D6E8I0_MAIZE|nr:3-ketoacyl-CoA thiolase 2 peroxisomal [Zea mays]ONM16728.1 3-ketoacyl-CoA thiolase 2 peroxisomal [Zea mays]
MEKAIDRQRVLLAHLLPSPSATSSQPQLAASACAAGDSAAYQRSSSFGDDVITAYRTPICKAKRGGFKDTYLEDLLTVVLKVPFPSRSTASVHLGYRQ